MLQMKLPLPAPTDAQRAIGHQQAALRHHQAAALAWSLGDATGYDQAMLRAKNHYRLAQHHAMLAKRYPA